MVITLNTKSQLLVYFRLYFQSFDQQSLKITIFIYALQQWCPTLSPFGTCGDRQLFGNGFLMTITLLLS
jgi:hypothetical protein